MPFALKKISDHSQLLIWRLDEELDFFKEQCVLTSQERRRLDDISFNSRKREFLCTRYLLQTYFNKNAVLAYEVDGRPILKNTTWKISISHSKTHLGILLTDMGQPGLDIELVSPRVVKISQKFVGKEEEQAFSCADPKTMTLLWSAKEATFKLLRYTAIDFKSEIEVPAFEMREHGMLLARFLRIACELDVALQYQFFEGNVIVWGIHS